MSYSVYTGSPLPFGVSRQGNRTNFAVFALEPVPITLLLFEPRSAQPFFQVPLSRRDHRTGSVWHAAIDDLPPVFEYGYLLQESQSDLESSAPANAVLLDPYARVVASSSVWGNHSDLAHLPHRFYPCRSAFLDSPPFDWNGDMPPAIPPEDLILYEMHVRGFTRHPSSGVAHPGTFSGIMEKIPYLKELGINGIELMPIHEFNEREHNLRDPQSGTPLCNYWGYSPVSFFAPMNRYSYGKELGSAMVEFKQLVKALHREEMEIILDVVFNHTAEGGHGGPILSLKGFANEVYYMIDKGHYLNFSGCGNTISANHGVVVELIITCLRYWVTEMHVDGFRFDLASALARGEKGEPLPYAPIIKRITEDPILSNTKLIAEPWDAGGLYQVGAFGHPSADWMEWNGRYRDVTRRFIKGDRAGAGAFARALCGSEDLYGSIRRPFHSVNLVTCHDGFTLADLVSYNAKHNTENAEENRDGMNENESWNCGVEGATDDPNVLCLRQRQMRNFFMALMVSQGVPLILMGDEYAHSRQGNNNAWCQDNERSWFLWDQIEENRDFHRFCRLMIRFRRHCKLFKRTTFLTAADIEWHGTKPRAPRWGADSCLVAFTLRDPAEGDDLYIAFNSSHEAVTVNLPLRYDAKRWCLVVNTAAESPKDIVEKESEAQALPDYTFRLEPYSAALLKARVASTHSCRKDTARG